MHVQSDYPWVAQSLPLVVSAPMMKISLGHYALATSEAGGLGFLAGGYDLMPLKNDLAETDRLLRSGQYSRLSIHDGMLPIGVGVQNWGADLDLLLSSLDAYPVTAVWFFGARTNDDLASWARAVRARHPQTKIWVQIGTVRDAVTVAKIVSPDVLVIQGSDAGGHGLAQRAGLITLLPEVKDVLNGEGFQIPLIAAGGIMDERSAAAAVCLGAQGVCLGTRLLASKEAVISTGYQQEILRAGDGGLNTVQSKVYDNLRGIRGWPSEYNARGIINQSYLDAQNGMSDAENEERYKEEVNKGDAGWGPYGRMTTYAGTGIGLVKEVEPIDHIVKQIHEGVPKILETATS